jgi:hypothetical protein
MAVEGLNAANLMHFLYIKIPVANFVSDREREMEDKVDHILKKDGLGSVAGWGDSLGAALPDGSRPVAYARIDVDVTDLALAKDLLHTALPALGAPTGTEIHYTINHRHFLDKYVEPDWVRDQPA